MQVALLSDTHVPSREPAIPEWVLDHVREADHAIHAGDFDTEATLATVRDAARDLTAVAGNIDPPLGLPDVATVTLGGVEFVVIHGTGPHDGFLDRVAEAVDTHAETDGPVIGVGGHTHEYVDTTAGGYRILNPGSATGARPATETTMLTATVADGECSVTVHRP